MPIHIAILKRPYLDLIISGRKRLECRLTRVACPPFKKISSDQKVLLKQSAGPVRAQAVVEKVLFEENLTPARVDEIYRSYNDLILAQDDFWHNRRDCRYCSLIWLKNITPCSPYRLRTRGLKAWHILEPQQLNQLKVK